ncbi:MAG: SDR family NAD(P)-dependent oxidoreductase [Bryobacteraceae bacterium]
MNLQGKVILITGASGGIGAALARLLHQRGARLTLLARSADRLQAVAQACDAVAVAGDVTKPDDRQRAIDATVERYGRLDVLINNAGVGMYVPAWRADMTEVRRVWELNLFSVIEMIQLAVPLMRKTGGGKIVNVSSIAGKIALPWFTNYTASKFAVCALTDALRIEMKPYGIGCLTVCPGYVKTEFQDNALAGRPPDRLWRMKRMAISAEQCAAAVVRGIERDARTVITPATGRVLIAVAYFCPPLADYILGKIYQGLDLDGLTHPPSGA